MMAYKIWFVKEQICLSFEIKSAHAFMHLPDHIFTIHELLLTRN